jgi:DNA-binding NarL/FixJ family response regulator
LNFSSNISRNLSSNPSPIISNANGCFSEMSQSDYEIISNELKQSVQSYMNYLITLMNHIHRDTNISFESSSNGRVERMNRVTRFVTPDLHFIDEINARLVKPMVSKRGTLPGELRIFALMRLGIHDNEQMAHILSCSLATIHTYKAHVYSRLNCSKDIFLQIVSPAS